MSTALVTLYFPWLACGRIFAVKQPDRAYGEVAMGRLITRLLMIGAAMGLAVQTADAKGCLEGAALGGIAGHMTHHTFLGIFGGCAGGMMVHHMYSKWKKEHPNGTMNDFVAENRDRLPAGWEDRLTTVGNGNLRPGRP